MNYYFLKTNVHIWKNKFLEDLDSILEQNGYIKIELNWENFELIEEDKNHFTLKGFIEFGNELVKKIIDLKIDNILIISDSTIGFYENKINRFIKYKLLKENIKCEINAINGSGFKAEPNFYSRVEMNKYKNYNNVLFIGGWNDNF